MVVNHIGFSEIKIFFSLIPVALHLIGVFFHGWRQQVSGKREPFRLTPVIPVAAMAGGRIGVGFR